MLHTMLTHSPIYNQHPKILPKKHVYKPTQRSTISDGEAFHPSLTATPFTHTARQEGHPCNKQHRSPKSLKEFTDRPDAPVNTFTFSPTTTKREKGREQRHDKERRNKERKEKTPLTHEEGKGKIRKEIEKKRTRHPSPTHKA